MLEWIAENPWAVGLVIAAMLVAVEMMTGDLWFLMGAIGALAGSIVAATDAPLAAAWVVAIIVALLSILLGRPPLIRAMRANRAVTQDALESLVGSSGEVTEVLTDSYVVQVLGGDAWTAKAHYAGHEFVLGETVRVTSRNGLTVTIEPDDIVQQIK